MPCAGGFSTNAMYSSGSVIPRGSARAASRSRMVVATCSSAGLTWVGPGTLPQRSVPGPTRFRNSPRPSRILLHRQYPDLPLVHLQRQTGLCGEVGQHRVRVVILRELLLRERRAVVEVPLDTRRSGLDGRHDRRVHERLDARDHRLEIARPASATAPLLERSGEHLDLMLL